MLGSKGKKSRRNCLFTKERIAILALTLARSGNNVSLIYLDYFFSYLLVLNFVNQLYFLVHDYDATIKKALRSCVGQ